MAAMDMVQFYWETMDPLFQWMDKVWDPKGKGQLMEDMAEGLPVEIPSLVYF